MTNLPNSTILEILFYWPEKFSHNGPLYCCCVNQYVSVHVFVCGHIFVEGPEINLSVFVTHSPPCLQMHQAWMASSPVSVLGLQAYAAALGLLLGFKGSNSGPYAYTVNT